MTKRFAALGMLLASVFLFYCKSAPPPAFDSGGEGTPLAVPPAAPSVFFASIPPDILRSVENGSPARLRRAAQALHKNTGGYSAAESVLLNVCADVTRLAWPQSPQLTEKPPVSDKNPYTGALESVRLGVYDESTGNVDFLACVLPSLVALTSSPRADYYARAERDVREALARNPDSVLANYLLGILCKKMGDTDAALEAFGRAVMQDGQCFETRLEYAAMLLQAGRLGDAEVYARALAASWPDSLAALKLAAETAFARQDYRQAEAYTARVLQKEPDNLEFLLFRARLLFLDGDFVKAASVLDAYARVDKTGKDYLLLRARLQHEWNRNAAAAVSTMEQAVSRYPSDPEVILAAARLALASRQKIGGKSPADFARALLAFQPGSGEARSILVADAVNRRDWQEAYRAAAAIASPTLADTLVRVDICLNTGNTGEAALLAESLYARDKDNPDVRKAYLKTLAASGDNSAALRLINAWLPQSDAAMKSFLFWQRSRLETNGADILNDLHMSLSAEPRNADALMAMYTYYLDRKDYGKAQYYLKQLAALNPNDEYIIRLTSELDRLRKQ